MIHDYSRDYYIGGSDTYRLMAGKTTKAYNSLVEEKLGLIESERLGTIYTHAGDIYEHPILYAIDWRVQVDGQIIHDKYPIRINYDGWLDGIILEVKTHKLSDPFEPPTKESTGKYKKYWMQCQAEMYVYKEMSKKYFLPDFEKLVLVSYGLYPDEYYAEPCEIQIDEDRVKLHKVSYDKHWVHEQYLPRVKEVARILKKAKKNAPESIEKSESD